jgi:hypothetical protein
MISEAVSSIGCTRKHRVMPPRGQVTLFNAIRSGECRNDNHLRASATALANAEAQLAL